MDYYQRTHIALNEADEADTHTDPQRVWYLLAKAAVYALLAIANEVSTVAGEVSGIPKGR